MREATPTVSGSFLFRNGFAGYYTLASRALSVLKPYLVHTVTTRKDEPPSADW
jgi:hypothetical protein